MQQFYEVIVMLKDAYTTVGMAYIGAIIDLQGQQLLVSYCNNRLDIDDCVILNGNIRYRGLNWEQFKVRPSGSVRHVTFYGPHDYGIRLFGCGSGVLGERNIIVDAIDTGPDFMYLTGIPSDWLPTGANVSLSLQGGSQNLFDNWSYHADPAANADPLRHFTILCDYG